MSGMEERKLNLKSVLIVKTESGRKKRKMSNPKIKLKIYNKYGKGSYIFSFLIILISLFILYTTFINWKETPLVGSIISIIIGSGFLIYGIILFTRPGKEHTEIIECERFEVIKNENT